MPKGLPAKGVTCQRGYLPKLPLLAAYSNKKNLNLFLPFNGFQGLGLEPDKDLIRTLKDPY